jgi:hypothetical protein
MTPTIIAATNTTAFFDRASSRLRSGVLMSPFLLFDY